MNKYKNSHEVRDALNTVRKRLDGFSKQKKGTFDPDRMYRLMLREAELFDILSQMQMSKRKKKSVLVVKSGDQDASS